MDVFPQIIFSYPQHYDCILCGGLLKVQVYKFLFGLFCFLFGLIWIYEPLLLCFFDYCQKATHNLNQTEPLVIEEMESIKCIEYNFSLQSDGLVLWHDISGASIVLFTND